MRSTSLVHERFLFHTHFTSPKANRGDLGNICSDISLIWPTLGNGWVSISQIHRAFVLFQRNQQSVKSWAGTVHCEVLADLLMTSFNVKQVLAHYWQSKANRRSNNLSLIWAKLKISNLSLSTDSQDQNRSQTVFWELPYTATNHSPIHGCVPRMIIKWIQELFVHGTRVDNPNCCPGP